MASPRRKKTTGLISKLPGFKKLPSLTKAQSGTKPPPGDKPTTQGRKPTATLKKLVRKKRPGGKVSLTTGRTEAAIRAKARQDGVRLSTDKRTAAQDKKKTTTSARKKTPAASSKRATSRKGR